MIFKAKQKKLDSKTRFQHQTFTKQLKVASSYKRNTKPVPENRFGYILKFVGLNSWWKQLLVAVFLGVMLYLVYMPNFLTLKNIIVSGIDQNGQNQIISDSQKYLNAQLFLKAPKNLLFLSTKNLKNYLAQNKDINQVVNIKKDFSHQSLHIDVEAKYTQFLLYTPQSVFDIYNDGSLRSTAGIKPDQFLTVANTQIIKLYTDGLLPDGENIQIITPEYTQKIVALNKLVLEKINLNLLYYKIESLNKKIINNNQETQSNDQSANGVVTTDNIQQWEIVTPYKASSIDFILTPDKNSNNGFIVKIDPQLDLSKTIDQLSKLLNQTSSERLHSLSYIDLRVQDKAYLCLKNTVCNN